MHIPKNYRGFFIPRAIENDLLGFDMIRAYHHRLSGNVLEDCKHNWLQWTNRFEGVDRFTKWAITHGIHDAILNQIAYRSKDVKKFYSFKDDYKFYLEFLYPYNSETIIWDQIDKIQDNSYILVSVPNTRGCIPENWNDLLKQCERTNSKIFFDGAYYGTSFETIDVNHSAIDCVAFSLSKNFSLNNIRSGVIFGNDIAWTLTIAMQREYYDYFSVDIANKILPKYEPLYVTKHAKKIQKDMYGDKACEIWFMVEDKDHMGIKTPRLINNEIKDKVQEAINVG